MKRYFPRDALWCVFFLTCVFSTPLRAGQSAPPAAERYCLELRTASGEAVFAATLGREERFTLRHIHSVHKSPVVEELGFGPDDTIAILEGRYADFGAGLPERGEKNQVLSFEDGRARLRFQQRHVPAIEVRVGRIAEHTLLVGDQAWPLTRWAAPGDCLVFRVHGGMCGQQAP